MSDKSFQYGSKGISSILENLCVIYSPKRRLGREMFQPEHGFPGQYEGIWSREIFQTMANLPY